MPRIRSIKPEHWGDRELPNISLQAQLLWIGMWNFSDDKGVIENNPVKIKSDVFPRRTDIRQKQILLWLDQLVKARYIVPFEFDNVSYYLHRTFDIHQRIDKPQPSKIPDEVIKDTLDRFYSENVPGTVLSVLDRKVKESNGVDVAPAPPVLKKIIEKKKEVGKPESQQVSKEKKSRPENFQQVLEHFDRMLDKQREKRKISFEAQKFWNHYESLGWKLSGQKIENWYALANKWIIREVE